MFSMLLPRKHEFAINQILTQSFVLWVLLRQLGIILLVLFVVKSIVLLTIITIRVISPIIKLFEKLVK